MASNLNIALLVMGMLREGSFSPTALCANGLSNPQMHIFTCQNTCTTHAHAHTKEVFSKEIK